mmetsp:Transcript_19961/g.38181  ORF Transcript_19961/g.38181 Transcript_19961/m.38181 type:complete len:194 (-) Transcript_19961:395-976(-)
MNDPNGTANVPPPPHNAANPGLGRTSNNNLNHNHIHNAANAKRPPLQRGGLASAPSFHGGAAVGSLRDLLESLRFDMNDANHPPARGDDAPGEGDDDAAGRRARRRRTPGTVPEHDENDDDEGSHGVFGETDSEDEAEVRYGRGGNGNGTRAAETDGRFRRSSPADDEESYDSTEYARGFDVDEDEDEDEARV